MKQALALALSLALTASAVAAPAPQSTGSTTTTSKTSKTRKKASSQSSVNAQIEQLKQAVDAQQQQIQQLMQEMRTRDAALQQSQQQAQQAQQQLQQTQSAASEAQQKADAAQTAANEQKDTVTKLNSDVKDVQTTLTNTAVGTLEEQKRVSGLEAVLGRFRFTGDVRVRGENFFQDFSGFQDRNRARIRVRFGFEGKLNEDFIGGIALAGGSLGDPTTTNETLTNFFDRKTIGLDRGYITYHPVAHKWVSVTGGKFAYTWQRTSATLDPDLNPEGFSEKFSWDLKNRYIKNVSVQPLQLLFNEVTSGTDSYAIGGEAEAKWQLGPWTATPSFTYLKWNNPSSILTASAFAVAANNIGFTSGTPPTTTTIPAPGEGPGCAKGSASGGTGSLSSVPPCAFAPNGLTNAVFLDAAGKPHFASGFGYADFILNNTFKTGAARFPVNLLVELLDNLDAAAHPFDTKGNVLTFLGSQNKEYGTDISIGQTKNKNDIQVGYAWLRQEQDSALSSFIESDQRAPTNILQNRVYGLWKVRANTVAAFTWWHGRTLNTNLQNNAALASKSISKAGLTEPYLNRLQFDLLYSF